MIAPLTRVAICYSVEIQFVECAAMDATTLASPDHILDAAEADRIQIVSEIPCDPSNAAATLHRFIAFAADGFRARICDHVPGKVPS